MSLGNNLNTIFVDLFQEIMDVEERALITDEFSDISINDMHVIEAIGDGEPKPSSAVSKKLDVTMGTLTKAIDGLVRKEYVKRNRSETDKRVVLLSLLDKGKRAYEHHAHFHEEMVKAVLEQLDPNEAKVLEKSLGKLQRFFVSQ